MIRLTTKIRKIRNSYRIVIPKASLKDEKIREGEEVNVILLKKGNVLKETFGTHKFSKSIEQIMKETDKELYDV